MPVLTIWGLGNECGLQLKKFEDRLCKAVANISALKLTEKQVSVFFPIDKVGKVFYREVIVFVDGLFEKPERNEDVRNELAKVIGDVVKFSFPNDLVEVFIRSFSPIQGFWTSGEEK